MNILVTDGENRSALAVTRSLGKKGNSVIVCGRGLDNISASSRFCRKAFTTSDPLNDGDNYIRQITEIVRKEKIDVVYPMTDQSIYRLNGIRKSLGGSVIMACAPPEKMEAVSNKYSLFKLAEKLDLAIPKTVYVNSSDDIRYKMDEIPDFPLVIKPAFSKIHDGERIIPTKVMYASNRDELHDLYAKNPVLKYPSLIQEMIDGEGTGLFTLYDVDHHLALFSHRRLLEKPPSGGVSVFSESIPLDDYMLEAAGRLLSEVQWTGIAMVEFKRDKKDGKAKLMEINGRFWGSLQLAISSGVDFPTLCLDYYLGNMPASQVATYRVGHKLKWFLGVLDHLIIRLKTKESLQKLSSDVPTRWQVMRELLKGGQVDTTFDVYDSSDMKPFVSEIKAYMRKLLHV